MAAVYEATDPGCKDSRVAIKFPYSDHGFDSSTTRFGQEQAVHKLLSKDENFVRLLHASRDPPYIAMEWVSEGDLFARQNEQPLTRAQAVEAIRLASEAVAKMHALSMIHRDLSPENIYVFHEDNCMKIKIGDFGITRIDRHLKPGETCYSTTSWGKPNYAPYEQLVGKAGKKSDVFALGCVLHFLVHGNPPEIALDNSGRIVRIVCDSGDSDLDEIIRRCVEFTPADRPDSNELAALLQGWLDNWRSAQDALKETLGVLMAQLRPWAGLYKETKHLALLSTALGLREVNERIQDVNKIRDDFANEIDGLFATERARLRQECSELRKEATRAREEATRARDGAASVIDSVVNAPREVAVARLARNCSLLTVVILVIGLLAFG